MNITIELPKLDDFKEVNKLAKQVHELHVNWRPDLFLSVDEVIIKDCFEEMIQAKEIFIARIQDEIVGYITFNIKEKNNPSMRYRKQLQIEAICVDEKNRGKGIGIALLEYTKKHGKENDCTDMYLTVNEENKKAIKVYEEFGFKVKSIAYSMQI
ncbi:MAG: GNAT family N-acetyltransferase [Clostridia bacterium]|nr:GNAT family N-acetyltransferase [Clostridia bacterium]